MIAHYADEILYAQRGEKYRVMKQAMDRMARLYGILQRTRDG